jgi:hypothetical protein
MVLFWAAEFKMKVKTIFLLPTKFIFNEVDIKKIFSKNIKILLEQKFPLLCRLP